MKMHCYNFPLNVKHGASQLYLGGGLQLSSAGTAWMYGEHIYDVVCFESVHLSVLLLHATVNCEDISQTTSNVLSKTVSVQSFAIDCRITVATFSTISRT